MLLGSIALAAGTAVVADVPDAVGTGMAAVPLAVATEVGDARVRAAQEDTVEPAGPAAAEAVAEQAATAKDVAADQVSGEQVSGEQDSGEQNSEDQNTAMTDEVASGNEVVQDGVSMAGETGETSAAPVGSPAHWVDPAIELFEQEVSVLEQRGGAYDPDLSETLVSLGMARMTQGEYEKAEQAFRRALHTTRVNHGLYNIEQLPILERLIELNTVTRDLHDLNQSYHYMFWLSKRIYGADDPRLLAAIDRMGRWHLAAYLTAADDSPMSHLLAAEELYDRAVHIIETNYGPNDSRLVNALYAVVVTKYQIAALVSRIEYKGDIYLGSSEPLDPRGRRVYEDARLRENMMIKCFSDGKNAMDRIASIHADNDLLPPESHALALVHLGDWNLLFDKWNSAHEAYSNAYALLSQTGQSREEIDSFFARPRSLPAIGLPEEQLEAFLAAGANAPANPETQSGAEPQTLDLNQSGTSTYADREAEKDAEAQENAEAFPYVLMSFDVSSTGRVTNIEILESQPEDFSLQRKAKKSIAMRRFRPRIENGAPVETIGMRMKLLFKD
jgi:tetratricopeptide (TPR) repeat protein